MESDEESGSGDMDYYMDTLKERIGNHVKMIWILDSGAGNYDTLWITNSLRGFVAVNLEV
jgi:acetylornithine deacetylase/succinyl-diaminopimelate desuccinylase-like protein